MSSIKKTGLWADVPWQIKWVIAVLSLEGLGNLLSMLDRPIAAFWLASKVLMIIGFVKRWRPTYIYTVIMLAIHVLSFALLIPMVALINLVLLVLTLSVVKHYFPDDSSLDTVTRGLG